MEHISIMRYKYVFYSRQPQSSCLLSHTIFYKHILLEVIVIFNDNTINDPMIKYLLIKQTLYITIAWETANIC